MSQAGLSFPFSVPITDLASMSLSHRFVKLHSGVVVVRVTCAQNEATTKGTTDA